MNTDPIPPPREYMIPEDFHQNIRTRFLNFFRYNVGDKARNSVIMLKGAYKINKHDEDQQYRVEQESNFHYLFGVDFLNCYAIIDVDNGKSIVFVPQYDSNYKMWNVVLNNDEIKQKFKLDEVLYNEEIEQWLNNRKPSLIYYFYGIDDYSHHSLPIPDQPFLQNYNSDYDELYYILTECRVRKTPQEQDIMRYICKISSEAHELVIKNIRKGNKEYQMEALYQYHTFIHHGCRFTPYECICASGTNGSVLHYEENSKTINERELILNDMGGKFYGYCSDITVTFPSDGRFTQKQAIIYNAVLDTQRQVHNSLKVGVNWGDMQLLAERTITKHLFNAGLIKGSMEDLIKNSICRLFFPHGLGHMLGLRTHDVGGYNKGTPPKLPELSQLQFRRDLDVGMIFTNEPGIYFIDFILQEAYKDPNKMKYLNKERIQEFMHVGGVRLEDDILLTANGPEILNDVPRTIKQVEACWRGEDWRQIND
ncbi:unnamed protein product [Paramecium primaurelia]|uniref:Xaa-Pro dipeptidase n=2 Tax=Paramecium TaxID=5884 RepID=A0A8S1W2F9_9CILI|nr:unnamed protein product [Paramecium primaurelia]CAD8184194.1 unnamed protein product [Paramecium pentaurelia]